MARDIIAQQSRGAREALFEAQLDRFADLQEGQHPTVLFIGCVDSRVLPAQITGSGPGDMLVLRNVGNIVPRYGVGERSVGAVVEFALDELKVQHIIVCGHTHCGGIQALDQIQDQLARPNLSLWIEQARATQTAVDARRPNLTAEQRNQALVERNVLDQLDNLRTYPVVARALAEARLTLHGWVYDLGTGHVHAWDAETALFVDEG